jgi:hypothetical protein
MFLRWWSNDIQLMGSSCGISVFLTSSSFSVSVSNETVMMTPGFTQVPHIRWCFVMVGVQLWKRETSAGRACLRAIERAGDSIIHRRPRAAHAHLSRDASSEAGADAWLRMAGHRVVECSSDHASDFFRGDAQCEPSHSLRTPVAAECGAATSGTRAALRHPLRARASRAGRRAAAFENS